MGFAEKYTTDSLKLTHPEDRDKIVLSNDAYAQMEQLELLINTLRSK